MSPTWIDILSVVSNLLTALAAVAIPIVLHRSAKRQREQSEKREMETRTLSEVDSLDRRASRVVPEIRKRIDKPYRYEKIAGDSELQGYVFELLNQYAYLCSGANKGLFVRHVIMDLRGNALRKTREDFDEYIQSYRKNKDSQAWQDIDGFLKADNPTPEAG